VDEFFATQQENLIEHYSFQVDNLLRQATTINNTTGLSISDVFNTDIDSYIEHEDPITFYSFGSRSLEYTLATGNVYNYTSFDHEEDTGGGYQITNTVDLSNPDGDRTGDLSYDTARLKVIVRPTGTGSTDTVFDVDRFATVLQRIETNHSDTVSEITNFVETVYPQYEAGDISLQDIVRPSELAAKASDSEENPISGADLAVMGLESDTQSKTTVRLVDDDIYLNGSLYLKTGSGPSLAVGSTYSPSSFAGPVYLAYSNYDGDNTDLEAQGVITVDQQFEITEAIGSDGAELATVEYSDEAGQQTTTTDTAELKEELDRLNELQTELQDQQKEIAQEGSGGGGGFLSGVDQGYSTGVLALGAAGVAWLLSKN
jgi:hypothetical protein